MWKSLFASLCSAFVTFTGWPTIPPFTPNGQLPLDCLSAPVQFPAALYFRQSCVAGQCVNPVNFTFTPDLGLYGVTVDAAAKMTLDLNALGWSQTSIQTQIWATDKELPDAYANLTLPITCNIGFPSEAGQISNQIAYEGRLFWYNVSAHFVNKAKFNLSWTTPAHGLPPNSQITVVDGILSGVVTAAEALVNGQDRSTPLSLYVEASKAGTNNVVRSNEFALTIVPLEGLKFARFVPQLYVNESLDFAYNVSAHFTNPNGFGVTWSTSHPLVRVNAEGILQVTAADSELILAQPILVVINGTDSRFHTATSNAITISVIPSPPVVNVPSSLPDAMCGVQCCSWNPGEYITNPSGRPLTFRLRSGLPFGSSIKLAGNGTFSGTPTMTDVYASPITLIVEVSNGIAIQVPFKFRVIPLASPSVIGNIPDRGSKIGQNFSFSVLPFFSLPARDNTFSLNATSSGIQIDSAGNVFGVFSLSDYTRRPTVQCTVTVSNVNACGGGTASATFAIILDPDFQAPRVNSTSLPLSQIGCQTIPLRLDFARYFVDFQGLTLNYSLDGLRNGTGLSFDTSFGVLTGKPNAFDVDNLAAMVTVCAMNSAGKRACLPAVSISFYQGKLPPAADPPIPSPVTAIQGDRFIGYFNFHFYDASNQPLVFSVAGLPPGSGMGIGPITGIFSGSPNEADYRASPLALSVFASNEYQGNPVATPGPCKGNGGRARADFILVVQKRPQPPICQPIPPAMAQLGQFFTLDVSSSFRSGREDAGIEFALRNLPRGSSLSIDPRSGVISGFISQVDLVNPPLILTVAVTNGYGACQSTLIVNGAPLAPPQPCPLAPQNIATQNAQAGSFFSIDLASYLVAYQRVPITYALAGLPQGSGFSFETQRGLLSGTPSGPDLAAKSMRLTLEARCGSEGQPVSIQFNLVIAGQCNACQNNGGCQQICFIQNPNVCQATCGCNSGMVLAPDQRSCAPGNPCDANNGGCEKICAATGNKAICSCPSGWILASNGRSCNYDACSYKNGNCEQLCITAGQQARCDCRTGTLKPDGKTCSSDLITVGTIPPALVIGCQMFIFDFATAFQYDGGNKQELSFVMSGLPSASGLSMTKKGLLSGTPTAADCAVSQPMTLTVEAQAGASVAHAVMFMSAFCDNDKGACKSAPVPLVPIPVAWAIVCADFELPLSSYFRQISDAPRFAVLGLPVGSGLMMTPDGRLRGNPTSADCAAAPLVLTILCTDSQRREFKGILNLKFRSCVCQTASAAVRIPIPVKVPFAIDRPVRVPIPIPSVPVRVPVPATVRVPVPAPAPAIKIPVQVPVNIPGPSVRVPVPVSIPGPAVRVPVPVSVSVPVPVPVPGPVVRVPVSVSVQVPVPVPGPSVRVPVPGAEIRVPVPGPVVSVKVPIPIGVPVPVPVPVGIPVPVPVPAPSPLWKPVPLPVPLPMPLPIPLPVPVPLPVPAPLPALPLVGRRPIAPTPTNLHVSTKAQCGQPFFYNTADLFKVNGLKATVSGLPPGTGITFSGGALSGAPNSIDAGTVNPLRVQVNGVDRYGTSASVVVSIDVKGQCFNMPPTPSSSLRLSSFSRSISNARYPIDENMGLLPMQVAPGNRSFVLNISRISFCGKCEPLIPRQYQVVGLPNGTGFQMINGALVGTPTSSDCNAIQPVTLSVQVSQDGALKTTATLRVLMCGQSTPDVPVVNGALMQATGSVGTLFFYNVAPHMSTAGSMVSFTAAGLPSGTNLKMSDDGVLSGVLSAADVGMGPILIVASDALGNTAQATLAIVVYPAEDNSAPSFLPFQTLDLPVGKYFSLNVANRFYDRNGGKGYGFEATLSNASGLKFDSAIGLLSGVPNQYDAQQYQPLRIIVIARRNGSETTGAIYLHIRGADWEDSPTSVDIENHVPISSPILRQVATEGVPFFMGISSSFFDPDGDLLKYRLSGLPSGSGLQIDSASGVISGIPKFVDCDTLQPLLLTVAAMDAQDEAAEMFLLTVFCGNRSINHAPVASGIPDARSRVGQPLLLRLSFSFADPDGDSLNFSIFGLPNGTGLSLDSAAGVLMGIPTNSDMLASPILLRVQASDSQASIQSSFTLTVDPRPSINSPPVGKPMPPITVSSKGTVSYNVAKYFTDPDLDPLTFQMYGLPANTGLRLDNGVLVGTPTLADSNAKQPLRIGFVASDGREGKAGAMLLMTIDAASEYRSYAVKLDEDNVNVTTNEGRPPQIEFAVGKWGTFQVARYLAVQPPVDENIHYRLIGLPNGTGLSLSQDTGVLSGIPTAADAIEADSNGKLLPVVVECTGVTTQSFNQTLLLKFESGANQAPLARSIPPVLVQQGEMLRVSVSSSFSDPDGDPLTYSVAGLPDGSGFDMISGSGVLFGIASQADISATQPLLLTIIASDDGGKRAQETLFLTVATSSSTRDSTSKSCQDLGWPVGKASICAYSPKLSGRCLQTATFQEAENMCESLGARLCSIQELTDLPLDSGECNGEFDRFWSSSECGFASTQAALTGSSNVRRNCSILSARSAKIKCCANSTGLGTMSEKRCDELADFRISPGNAQRTVCAKVGSCAANSTWAQARNFCQDLGTRLCSSDEVAQGMTQGSSCDLDTKRVWTSTECGAGQVFVQTTSRSDVPQCAYQTAQNAFHCCADMTTGTDFQNFRISEDKGKIQVSWAWPAYSLARLSLQRQSNKVSETQTWVVPPGGDQIRLEGDVQFALGQLQPGSKYTVRITPMRRTSNGFQLVPGQAVQMQVPVPAT